MSIRTQTCLGWVSATGHLRRACGERARQPFVATVWFTTGGSSDARPATDVAAHTMFVDARSAIVAVSA
jgi:hypothetical protein